MQGSCSPVERMPDDIELEVVPEKAIVYPGSHEDEALTELTIKNMTYVISEGR